jgi:hypothetical protein
LWWRISVIGLLQVLRPLMKNTLNSLMGSLSLVVQVGGHLRHRWPCGSLFKHTVQFTVGHEKLNATGVKLCLTARIMNVDVVGDWWLKAGVWDA